MATNEILPFASSDTGTNLLTQAEYSTDSQRTIGNQPGIARSKLVNKTLRQASIIAAGVAEYMANRQGDNVTDSKTASQLEAMLANAIAAQINASLPEGVPAGSVIYVARSLPPVGYLKANGAVVSRTTYSALFSAIGTTFGSGDGSTTFGLPDLRAEFLRGLDDGRGVDSGRALGTTQAQAIQNHTHSLIGYETALPGAGNGQFALNQGIGAYNDTRFINSTGGSETRPRNVALLACIKF